MIISTDNENKYSLTIMLPGTNAGSVDDLMIEDNDDDDDEDENEENGGESGRRPRVQIVQLDKSSASSSESATAPADASVVNVPGRASLNDEVVLMSPGDDPVIWNENVCKLFVKEKSPPAAPAAACCNQSSAAAPPSFPVSCLTDGLTDAGHNMNDWSNSSSSSHPQLVDHSCKSDGLIPQSMLVLNGLNSLRQQGVLVDVTLWAEKTAFPAHRAVLAAASEYFQAMFTKPMRERDQANIHLVGMSASALASVLDYAYTGQITLSLVNVQSVLAAAAHLRFERLVDACATYLHQQIDPENCSDIATLADTFGLAQLKANVFKAISKNLSRLKNIVINKFSRQHVRDLLKSGFPVDVPELELLAYVLQWIEVNCSDEADCCHFDLLQSIRWSEVRYDDVISLLTSSCHGHDHHRGSGLVNQVLSLAAAHHHSCSSPPAARHSFTTAAAAASSSDKTAAIWRAGLKNSRGLESALVMVGGFGLHGITNKLSYFLPSQRIWNSLTEVPHIECSNFGCAVLNNNVYVVGGCFDQVAAASSGGTCNLQAIEESVHPFGFKYDPLAEAWSSIAPMLRERCRFTLTPVGGRHLYAVGGGGGSGSSHLAGDFQMQHQQLGEEDTCEVYDTNANVWSAVASLPSGDRSQHAACSIKITGKTIDAILGQQQQSHQFNLDMDKQEAALHDNKNRDKEEEEEDVILVSGGLDSFIDPHSSPEILDTILLYRVDRDSWHQLPSRMSQPRTDHSMLVHDGRILFVGGWTIAGDVMHADEEDERILVKEVESYDVTNNRWSLETMLPNPRYHAGAAIVQGKLCIAGGFKRAEDQLKEQEKGSLDCYNLKSKTWENDANMAHPDSIWEHICQPLFVPIPMKQQQQS